MIQAKRFSLALAILIVIHSLCFSVLSVGAAAQTYSPSFNINAEYVYLYNLDTDKLIFEKNGNEAAYPASLTKIMTCILALELVEDLDATQVTYPTYVEDYLYRYQRENGAVSLGGLRAGEVLTMRQLLYALMLPSANEAAMIVADYLGDGSQEAFVEKMNARAKELGATSTNFVNPNGLFSPEHKTTAKDMFLLARHAMGLPGFMEVVTTTSYSTGPTNKHDNLVWNTTNYMSVSSSGSYYPAIKGIKTGTLPQSGRCFVSSASKDGFTYLLVVMGAPVEDANGNAYAQNLAFEDTAKIYNWAFDTFKVKSLVEKGKFVDEIPLRLSSDAKFIRLMTDKRFTALLPDDIEATSVTYLSDIPESVNAPIQKGDPVGILRLILSGEEIGQVPLVAAESVSESQALVLLDKVQTAMRSFWFKFIVILLVLLVVLYILLMIVRNRNRRRFSNYRPRRRL